MKADLENIPGVVGLDIAKMESWAEVFDAIDPADFDMAYNFMKDCGLIAMLKDVRDLRRPVSTLCVHAMLKPKSDDSFVLDYAFLGVPEARGGRYRIRRARTQFAINRNEGLVIIRFRIKPEEEVWKYIALRAYHVQPAGRPVTLRIETDGAIHGVDHDSYIPVDVIFVSDDIEGSQYNPIEVNGVKWVANCWGSERNDEAVRDAITLSNSMTERYE